MNTGLRKQYDEELAALNTALDRMGRATAQALRCAIDLIGAPDADEAQRLVDADEVFDGMERDIEHRCMQLLLRQQPVAGDLRRVSTALKIVTDVERMADHAADIAEMTRYLRPEDATLQRLLPQVIEMADTAVAMDEAAVQAFVAEDMDAALQVIARDDTVDAQFDAVKKAIAAALAADPEDADAALDLLMIAKYLERLGDHAVNVAEWVRFLKTGLYRGQRMV